MRWCELITLLSGRRLRGRWRRARSKKEFGSSV
jgi:hypothetical protein